MSRLFAEDIREDPKAQQRVHEWSAALRSDEFQQGTGELRTKTGFCCMGVACHLYDPSRWDRFSDEGSVHQSRAEGGWSYLYRTGTLPDSVRDSLRLNSSEGHYSDGSLTNMNDNGVSFKEIADLIDHELAEVLKS